MKRKIIRINKGEVVNEYSIRDDEKIVVIEGILYILSEVEYQKLIKGEIEIWEIDDAPYESNEEGEMLVFECED